MSARQLLEHGTAAHFRAGHAAGDFPDKAQERHVASRQPECTKLRRLGRYDMPDAGKVLQESGCRRRALPKSQQPRQQLVLSGFFRRQHNSVAPAPLARGYIRLH